MYIWTYITATLIVMNFVLQINLFSEDMNTSKMKFVMIILSICLYISFTCCTYEIVDGIKKTI